MKEYIKPEIEYVELVVADVITGDIDVSMGFTDNPFAPKG